MMRRLREIPCRSSTVARIAVQSRVLVALIQCPTMAAEVVKVTTESVEDVRFWYSGKNPTWFAVFWRIFVRLCSFRRPLTHPSVCDSSFQLQDIVLAVSDLR